MSLTIKIHESYRNVVAIADTSLIGRKFKEGKKVLDVKERFFKGEEKTAEEAEKIITFQTMEDATFNIIGEESTTLAVKCNIIEEDSIKRIEGVPFALKLL